MGEMVKQWCRHLLCVDEVVVGPVKSGGVIGMAS